MGSKAMKLATVPRRHPRPLAQRGEIPAVTHPLLIVDERRLADRNVSRASDGREQAGVLAEPRSEEIAHQRHGKRGSDDAAHASDQERKEPAPAYLGCLFISRHIPTWVRRPSNSLPDADRCNHITTDYTSWRRPRPEHGAGALSRARLQVGRHQTAGKVSKPLHADIVRTNKGEGSRFTGGHAPRVTPAVVALHGDAFARSKTGTPNGQASTQLLQPMQTFGSIAVTSPTPRLRHAPDGHTSAQEA